MAGSSAASRSFVLAALQRIGIRNIGELSPAVLSAFIVERSAAGLAKSTVRTAPVCCGCSCAMPIVRASSRPT